MFPHFFGMEKRPPKKYRNIFKEYSEESNKGKCGERRINYENNKSRRRVVLLFFTEALKQKKQKTEIPKTTTPAIFVL